MATNSTSFANTPQASDDDYKFTENELLAASLYNNLTNTITLDVMSDDLGGKAKKLFSISGEDGTDPADLWTALKNTDVGKQPEMTANGNYIQITADGKIAYTLNGLNNNGLNSLSEGERISDTFTYAIRLANGTLSWATVNIEITGSNDGPTDITLSNNTVNENSDGAVIGTVTTTDVDRNDTHTYTVSDARFEVVNGELKLKAGESLNYEQEQSIGVSVTTNDGHAIYTETFTINVTDVNEAPNAGTDQTVAAAENVDAFTVLATVTGTDPDTLADTDSSSGNDNFNNLRYSINTDASGKFEIDAATGAVTLKDGASLDYETAQSYTITIAVTDMDGLGLSDLVDITINVEDVNEAPNAGSDQIVSASENVDTSTVLATVSGTDPDTLADTDSGSANDSFNNLRYSINADASGKFEIDPVTGAVTLKDGASLDYETAQSHTITVAVTDMNGAGLSDLLDITINVDDVNEAPNAGTDQTVSTSENVDASTVLATVTGTDPDTLADTDSGSANDSFNNLRYSINTDASGKFEIDAATGAVTLKDGASLDYETAQSHTITVAVTDMDGSGMSDLVNITINVADVNETPNGGTDQTVSTPENVNTTTVIATVAGTDPDTLSDSDSSSANNAFNNLRYAISADVSGKFEIDAATGAVTLKDGASLDYETAQSHTITVAVTDIDGAGLTDLVDITINVTDVSEGVVVASPYTGSNDPNDYDTLVPSSTTGTSPTTGNDILVDTTPLNQPINLGAGNDVYYAGSGDDAATSGGSGNDTIYGQAGNDSINGNNDLDNIYGGSGNDSLDGNNDADNIYGGSGSDTINGGGGNDIIVGGYGADTLAGGTGADKFSYLSVLDTGDVITDWETTDILDFSAIAGITGTTATNTNSVVANSVTYHQDGVNTMIWADTDGNTATAELQVTLTNIVATTLNDTNFNL